MNKYFINLHGVYTNDPKFKNLLASGEMRIEFTGEEFKHFHRCAHLWNEKSGSVECADACNACRDMIYNKLNEYYARLREFITIECADAPVVIFDSWHIDGELYA